MVHRVGDPFATPQWRHRFSSRFFRRLGKNLEVAQPRLPLRLVQMDDDALQPGFQFLRECSPSLGGSRRFGGGAEFPNGFGKPFIALTHDVATVRAAAWAIYLSRPKGNSAIASSPLSGVTKPRQTIRRKNS